MTIGLLSDTHGWLHRRIFEHFSDCDEVWHVGDFGSMEVVETLQKFKPLKGVYGNIDDRHIRKLFPETNIFYCENISVMMQHIGGYPGKYAKGVKEIIQKEKIQLFISGHSHILKIMYDSTLNCLHINPGACGLQGWHKQLTLIKFTINNTQIGNCQVIELDRNSNKE